MSLFGGAAGSSNNNTSGEAQKTSIFGQQQANSGGSNLFGGGGGGDKPATSLFGGGAASPSPFGSAFGQNTGSGIFGGAAKSNSGSTGFSFGKPADNAQGTSSTPSLFGNTTSGTPSGSGAATPTAPTSGFNFGNNNPSFTPAGPPPTNNLFSLGDTAKNTTSLFGNAAPTKPAEPSSTPSLFGQPQSNTPASNDNPFAKPAAPAPQQASASAPKPNLFQFPSSGSTNKDPAAPTSTKVPTFSFPSSNAAASGTSTPTAEKPSLFATTPTVTPQASSLFGAPAQKTDAQAAPNNALATLGQKKEDAQSSTPAASPFAAFGNNAKKDVPAPAAGGNMFSGFGQKKADATTAAPAASPFAAFGKEPVKADTTATAKPQDNAAPAAAPASLFGTAKPAETTSTAPSLFGAAAKSPDASKAAPSLFGSAASKPAEPNSSSAQAPAIGAAGPTNALGASTTGPAPTPQSRLKNKSMDEIITRWASDLSKYQKDFQAQAEKVAAWDRMLLDNGNAISKLYSKTFQAERDTAEVQKQLSAVESHQDELSSWLDRYEKEVDEMMARQVGQGEGLQGPDQERERT
jgi:nuclear pore complex protein Nup62